MTYRVRYHVKTDPAGWQKAELGEDGGCDALIIHSIMYEPDGGRSEMVVSVDGDGNELRDIELFRSWVMLAHRLMGSEQLTDEGRRLAREVFLNVRERVVR